MRLLLTLVLSLLSITVPAQADPVPGSACTSGQTNYTSLSGGPDSGGAAHLLRCNGTSWVGLMTWNSDDNVGVGIAEPDTRFHVNGIVQATGINVIDNTSRNIYFRDTSTPMEWYLGTSGDDFYFASMRSGSTYRNRIWFQDSGNETFMEGKLVLNGWGPARATLDVRGYAKLRLNSTAPVACGADYHGSLAATANGSLCFCKTSNAWRNVADTANCTW